MKEEDEWDSPHIVRYLNALSDSEIEKIKELAKPRVRGAANRTRGATITSQMIYVFRYNTILYVSVVVLKHCIIRW